MGARVCLGEDLYIDWSVSAYSVLRNLPLIFLLWVDILNN